MAFSPDIAGYQPMMREPEAANRPAGSRRRRLWEISAHCHCALLGVCLPASVLRRVMERAARAPMSGDDYEVHVAAVNEARRRSPLVEAVQKELEQRHAVTVRRFNGAKSPDALLTLWEEHAGRGDVGGALWAALTHPRCDAATEEKIYRRVHMLQHQAGAGCQNDAARLTTLTAEKTALTEEVERARERYRVLQAERGQEQASQNAEIGRLRSELAARDALVKELRDNVDRIKRDAEDLETRQALTERIGILTEKNRELTARLAPSNHGVATAQTATTPPTGSLPALAGATSEPIQITLAPLAEGTRPSDAVPPPPDTRAVLCVGGLHRAVAVYRNIVEKRGGRFIHHDGGREDSVHRLEANLAAADLVVCQAGCISHSAYWQVKEHCKRTGKRCIYLEKPSASALSRGLAESTQVPIATA